MLDTYLDTVERQRKRFTVYSATDTSAITNRLSTRNVLSNISRYHRPKRRRS
ncbi:hypothetical protein Halar_1955 [halophilic archaeon DL31]|jgi:hypothetical protein|nr:hypothetical protein Halar_1955 [halophilic archaeon DL31]